MKRNQSRCRCGAIYYDHGTQIECDRCDERSYRDSQAYLDDLAESDRRAEREREEIE